MFSDPYAMLYITKKLRKVKDSGRKWANWAGRLPSKLRNLWRGALFCTRVHQCTALGT